MSNTGAFERPLQRFGLQRWAISRQTLILVVAAAGLLALMVVVSRLSLAVYAPVAIATLLLFAFAALRSPRAVLVTVALAPIFDRYLISIFIPPEPPELHAVTNFLSEGLLLLAAVVIVVRGVREGTLIPALRHPVTAFFGVFLAVAAVSAVVNGVSPLVAAAGLLFTVDAAALFFLPRIAGFAARPAMVAAVVFVAVATIAALLAIGQVVIIHNFLGMETSSGRFGEGQRVTAFFGGNPNMLGAVLAMALPLPAFAAWRTTGRRRWGLLLVTYILALALLFTFSRGAWISVALAMLVVGVAVDRRALLSVIAIALIAYGSANVIPRNLVWRFGGSAGSEAVPLNFDIGESMWGRVDAIAGGRDLRFLFIENAIPIIADHPLVGTGPGTYGGAIAGRLDSDLYDEYTAGVVPENRTVDNFWLHLVVEFGILGALAFLGMLLVGIGQLIERARHVPVRSAVLMAGFAGAAIVLTVDSLTEMLLEGNTTSFTMWLFLGIGSALIAWEARQTDSPAEPGPGEHPDSRV